MSKREESGLWADVKASAVATAVSYEELIQADTHLLWSIQDLCYRTPWLDRRMAKIVSKNPWEDICALIWVFFLLGVIEFRSLQFFPVMINLGISYLARRIIEAPRPVEVDIRLQPLTDLGAESYGFPSLESYMSVVVMGNIFSLIENWNLKLAFTPLGLFIVILIGFSRVYTRSRFPHQIVGSWILGTIGLVLVKSLCYRIQFHSMYWVDHLWCTFIAVMCFLVHFGLTAENNDSRLLYIPKKEFVRVIGGIINNTSTQDQSEATTGGASRRGGPDGDNLRSSQDGSIRVTETPRSTAVRKLMEIAAEKLRKGDAEREVKHDSFYYLQQTLERREEEVRKARLALLGDNNNVKKLIHENAQVNFNYNNGSRSIFRSASSSQGRRSRQDNGGGNGRGGTGNFLDGRGGESPVSSWEMRGKGRRKRMHIEKPPTYFSEPVEAIPIAEPVEEIFLDPADDEA